MSEVETLLKKYERHVLLPWEPNLAPPQRVWFAGYDPAQERRLRPRLGAFEAVTRAAGHGWSALDVTNAFPDWMAEHEYREAYFAQPDDMGMALADFADSVAHRLSGALSDPDANPDSVVALVGIGSLFGLARWSDLLPKVEPLIRGRLLAFFPGHRNGTNYRLFDARDGWNYHAVWISAAEGD